MVAVGRLARGTSAAYWRSKSSEERNRNDWVLFLGTICQKLSFSAICIFRAPPN